MKYLICLLTVLLLSCAGLQSLCKRQQLLKPEEFNYENSTALAHHQDELFNKYKSMDSISENEIKELENNIWVMSAVRLAPGNLVVRQWCLIDLLRNKPTHAKNIYQIVTCLSYNKTIYAEGYSYYLYVRNFLDMWTNVFSQDPITGNIKEALTLIDKGFERTAYKKSGKWYPAPFGDVYEDQILDSRLQAECDTMTFKSCTVGIVTMTKDETGIIYSIKAIPIGLNIHIPKGDATIHVINEKPAGFIFYTGIDNKYKSKEEEYQDLMDPRRLNSIKSICK